MSYQLIFNHVRTGSTLPGFTQYYGELMCLAQGPNILPLLVLKPRTSRIVVRCSTTTSLRSTISIHKTLRTLDVCSIKRNIKNM